MTSFSCGLKYIHKLGGIQDSTKATYSLSMQALAACSSGGNSICQGTQAPPNSSLERRPETLGAARAEALWGPEGLARIPLRSDSLAFGAASCTARHEQPPQFFLGCLGPEWQ